MLKVVVFDSGYGGELFADQLERELPILNVIRVIDWRHASEIQSNFRSARKVARTTLRPYIGKVDLIIFANHYVTATNLKYFRRKYKNQKFLGLSLKQPNDNHVNREIVILTTKPMTRTINYYNYVLRLHRKARTLTLDAWASKIDNGELSPDEIRLTLNPIFANGPKELIFACSHFSDLTPDIKNLFGHNLKIYDSFDDTISMTCKILKIRGGTGKKAKS